MILIDSLYINMGGGKVLLDYLCSRMIARGVTFTLLRDSRCGNLRCDGEIRNVIVMKAGLRERKAFYRKHREDYSAVLCFGNVPPPIRLNVPVYTYFHNINLLTLRNCASRMQRLKFALKRSYIKHLKGNTSWWIVQTSNMALEMQRNLGTGNLRILPFYDDSEFSPVVNEQHGDGYCFVGEASGSKGHLQLLQAWEILLQQGLAPRLHLTVTPEGSPALVKYIVELNARGANIVNHGFVSRSEVHDIYLACKATVYTSLNESFGLGIAEALESGCDVLGADLPYVHSLCNPSEVFNPLSPHSISEAVIRYETLRRSTTKYVRNHIDELISLVNS